MLCAHCHKESLCSKAICLNYGELRGEGISFPQLLSVHVRPLILSSDYEYALKEGKMEAA